MPNQNGLFIALRFGGAMTLGAAGTYLLLKREHDNMENELKANANAAPPNDNAEELIDENADNKHNERLPDEAASSSKSFGSAKTHISSGSAKSASSKRASYASSKRASSIVSNNSSSTEVSVLAEIWHWLTARNEPYGNV